MSAFSRILIANRGEIACRIAKSAHALGYETVAVFSDADRNARHVRAADTAYHLGPSPAATSYLNIERLLEAARATGCSAVHPGYGFLAESPQFAAACRAQGLVFIGPPTEAIRLMGSKRQAKLRLAEAGVPPVPGYSGPDQSIEALTRHARELGPPLMIKASAGGGGRGLRRIDALTTLADDLGSARAEAQSAFGDGELILERAIVSPRHVEIQVFADQHGHVIHLSERDCSVQRRHQKVVEEAPSPAVDAALRERMGAAAVAAARAIGYEGAGTVEFLVDSDGCFYFMEMNTRLQVEHPVTELVTGVDLVAWQLQVAAGQPLPVSTDVAPTGHAIEVRLYAEDPEADFVPQTGTARNVLWPQGPGVRVDHGIDEGQHVTPFYDAMLAKIVAVGRTRDEARKRLIRALSETRMAGVITNREFLIRILKHAEFARGAVTTDFIPRHRADLRAPPATDIVWALAAMGALEVIGPEAWWSTGSTRSILRLSTPEITRRMTLEVSGSRVTATWDDTTVVLDGVHGEPGAISYEESGVRRRFELFKDGPEVAVWDRDTCHRFVQHSVSTKGSATSGGSQVLAPMAGKVVAVRTAEGASVEKGDVLVVVEAMKMQLELSAERGGQVAAVHVVEGEQIQIRQVLIELGEET